MQLRWYDKLMILRYFCTWRRRAGLPVVLHSYRSQLEALQASTKLLHMEQSALRLFKVTNQKEPGGNIPWVGTCRRSQEGIYRGVYTMGRDPS
eukprot:1148112-Pyramimonas_sp.AAC.1